MAKGACSQARQPEFDPQNPGGEGENRLGKLPLQDVSWTTCCVHLHPWQAHINDGLSLLSESYSFAQLLLGPVRAWVAAIHGFTPGAPPPVSPTSPRAAGYDGHFRMVPDRTSVSSEASLVPHHWSPSIHCRSLIWWKSSRINSIKMWHVLVTDCKHRFKHFDIYIHFGVVKMPWKQTYFCICTVYNVKQNFHL